VVRYLTIDEIRGFTGAEFSQDGHLRAVAQLELSEDGQYFQLPPSLVNDQVAGSWSFGELDIVVVTTAVARRWYPGFDGNASGGGGGYPPGGGKCGCRPGGDGSGFAGGGGLASRPRRATHHPAVSFTTPPGATVA
jgi:hypothetical protein